MEKKIAKTMMEESPDDLKIFVQWGLVNEKIVKFQNNSNLVTFQFMFGEEKTLSMSHVCEIFKPFL